MAKTPKRKGKPVDIIIERKIRFNRAAQKAARVEESTREVVEAKRVRGVRPAEKVQSIRTLTPKEETLIKREFLKLNGIFDPNKKDCSRISAMLPDEISVRQVSGYVTRLHKQVEAGLLELKDKRSYLATIRAHRKHWLTYSGEKYDEMRERAKTTGRKPVYVARVGRGQASSPRHKMVK